MLRKNKKRKVIKIMLWNRRKEKGRVRMGDSGLLINRKKEIIKRIKARQRPKIKK